MSKKRPITSTTSSNNSSPIISKSAEKRAKRASEEILTRSSREDLPKIYDWAQMDKLDAGVAFELVYGFKPNVNFEYYGEVIDKANSRKWWERSSPQTQCGRAIGNLFVNSKNSMCYICGFPIDKNDPTPECEHILPVYKASMYLTLYNDDFKNIVKKRDSGKALTLLEQKTLDEITMEYAWAHRCCNQKKSDDDFIRYNTNKGGYFDLDFKETTQILKKIVTSLLSETDGHCLEKSLITQFRKKFNTPDRKKIIQKWIEERIDILGDPKGKVKQIINYLNKFKSTTNYAMFTLINLCNLISSADMEHIYSVWRKIGGLPPIKQTPPVSQITKATVLMQITEDSFKFVNGFDWDRKTIPVLQSIYRNIFDIPENINFDVRRKGDYNKINEGPLITAMQGSFIYLNGTNALISDFFQKFYTIITYPNITNHGILFPEMDGKVYASNMVGQAFKILLLGRMILNMKNIPNLSLTTNTTDQQFYDRFVVKYNDYIEELIDIKNNYFNSAKIDLTNRNPYHVFIIVFTRLLEEIDLNLKTFFIDAIKQKDAEIKNLFEDNNLLIRYNQLSDLLLSPEDKVNNRLSNIEYALVEFYMDEANYLKMYDTWNPDIPDKDDTQLTTGAQGIAIGATGLLNLLKTKNTFETDEIKEIADGISKGPIINEINGYCVTMSNECNQIIQNYVNQKYPGQTFTERNQVFNNLSSEDLGEILLEIYKQKIIQDIQNNFENMSDVIITYFHIKKPNTIINNTNLNQELNSLSIDELREMFESYDNIQSAGKKHKRKSTRKMNKRYYRYNKTRKTHKRKSTKK